uniref:Uncharacterized protein n=1 Tax=Biomphalaria glabrata TaxID=6526 RepID=A0A2C9KLM2_BIOGL
MVPRERTLDKKLLDSLSSLQAIESSADTLPEPLAKTLACVGRLQEKHDIRTTFQYVPGHVGVEGNTKADLLAKLGTKLDPVDEPQTFEQARAIVDEWARDKWCKSWENGNTGREVWQNLKGPSKSDEWWRVTITRYRTGHCPIGAYFAKFKPNFDSRCRHCQDDVETVNHIHYECATLHPKQGHMSEAETGLHEELALYGDREALRRTAAFLVHAGDTGPSYHTLLKRLNPPDRNGGSSKQYYLIVCVMETRLTLTAQFISDGRALGYDGERLDRYVTEQKADYERAKKEEFERKKEEFERETARLEREERLKKEAKAEEERLKKEAKAEEKARLEREERLRREAKADEAARHEREERARREEHERWKERDAREEVKRKDELELARLKEKRQVQWKVRQLRCDKRVSWTG